MNRLPSLLRYVNPLWLSERLAAIAPLPVRLIVGYGFIAHGCAKITKDPENFAAILHALGVPFPHLMSWATIVVELGGGLAILLGAFVPLITIPMIVVLLVATFTVHIAFGFTSIKLMSVVNGVPHFGPPGYETDMLYVAGLLTLVFGGSGPFALDSLLAPFYRRLTGWVRHRQ